MWPKISILSSYYSISTPEGGSNLNTVTSCGGQTWIAQTCEGPHHEFNSSFLQHASGKGIECDYIERNGKYVLKKLEKLIRKCILDACLRQLNEN